MSCLSSIIRHVVISLVDVNMSVVFATGIKTGGIMGTFRNVSKAEPCPICGKSDWCSILSPDTAAYYGQELYVCRRISTPETQSPINSRTYYLIKELSDASCLYSDVEKKTGNSEKPFGYTYRPSPKPAPKKDYGVPPRSNKELDIIYRDFLHMLPLSKGHIRKLSADGWPQTIIRSSNIRSLSLKKSLDVNTGHYTDVYERIEICNSLLEKHSSLLGVPGFYQDSQGKWAFVGKPGMLIPLYDVEGNMYRLRLRLDHPPLDENGKEKNKYKNFSSYHEEKDENGVLSNIYHNGCRSGSQIGIYYHPEKDDSTICYITEGEKKAIIANFYLNCIIISLPGVNSYSKLLERDRTGMSTLDYLAEIGCINAVVAYDADKYANENVLIHEHKLVDLLKSQNFNVNIGNWNPGFGKGLDDILVLGVRPHLSPV